MTDFGMCPYLARWQGVAGSDPEAGCFDGHCTDEPECVTCEPRGGWPSRVFLAELLDACSRPITDADFPSPWVP